MVYGSKTSDTATNLRERFIKGCQIPLIISGECSLVLLDSSRVLLTFDSPYSNCCVCKITQLMHHDAHEMASFV